MHDLVSGNKHLLHQLMIFFSVPFTCCVIVCGDVICTAANNELVITYKVMLHCFQSSSYLPPAKWTHYHAPVPFFILQPGQRDVTSVDSSAREKTMIEFIASLI